MITTPIDYESLLYLIQDQNRQTIAITLPKDEQIYNIDLNSRIIEAPKYLSIQHDHNAETIYFTVDRYFDGTDLARNDIYLVIQYENANPDKAKRGYIYAPPFIDITTFKKEQKILFPWVIEGPATAFPGDVKFSIKFYRLNSLGNYEFNLNTLPSKSTVLVGMDIYKDSENYEYTAETVEGIYLRLNQLENTRELYWLTI